MFIKLLYIFFISVIIIIFFYFTCMIFYITRILQIVMFHVILLNLIIFLKKSITAHNKNFLNILQKFE